MKSTNDSVWRKTFEEVVDQRKLELPPTWVATGQSTLQRIERGQSIDESGKGRLVANSIVNLLGQAREIAVVSSFLLADQAIEDALLAASKGGVRFYVLLASEARLGREPSEGEFEKGVLEQHKSMLTRLGGHVLFRSASHFHAKLVIIDPETNPKGMLLTANLTSEALERNDELAVILSAEEVREAAVMLRWAMWESAEHELVDPDDRFRAVQPLGNIEHPSPMAALVATTSKANSIRSDLVELIDEARSQIIISSFGWDVEHQVVKRLCARAREGIGVTVLARIRPASMPALIAMAEAGANVWAFQWLHAKAIWTDSGRALVMSANLQPDGLDQGFELGVRLNGNRALELKERLEMWSKTAPWRFVPKPKLGEVSGAVLIWQNGRLEKADIKPVQDVELGKVMASSAHNLHAPRPNLPSTGPLPRLAHSLLCIWTVEAPTISPKAKEHSRPSEDKKPPESYSPPVYREPNGRLVVAVRSADELEKAVEVMAETGAAAVVLAEGAI